MFRSKRRPLIFTQADHARFAATIALNWRDRPPLPFDSFVRGVADHDRGYGEHDVAEIGVVDDAHWVEIQRAGFRPHAEDAVVDLVAALHIRRLLSPPENELETAALDELDELLPALVAAAGVGRDGAEQADAITSATTSPSRSRSRSRRAATSAGSRTASTAKARSSWNRGRSTCPCSVGSFRRSKRTATRNGSFRSSCRSSSGRRRAGFVQVAEWPRPGRTSDA